MLATIVISLAMASVGRAATVTVCASGCAFTTIADAIAATASGDIISITEPVQGESNIEISHDLTIQGQGASSTAVDGGASGPVFTIASGVTATIQSLTIQNGGGSTGGGILNSGGNLTLNSVVIAGNLVFAHGAGIYTDSGTVLINNSTISDNTAFVFGGGIYNLGSTITFVNSTLSNNSAFSFGGGIYNASGTVRFSGSTLSGNSADSFGGAIFNQATADVTNCTLFGNSAGYGGGIFDSGALALSSSTLSGNSAVFAGGGLYGASSVKNSIIGGNSGGDCSFAPNALAANLDTDGTCGAVNFTQVTLAQLNLAPPAINAPGTTQTIALMEGSAAINAVTDCTDVGGNPLTIDQRGAPRPDAGETVCDIGAYEFQDAPPPAFEGTPGTANCHGRSVSALTQQFGSLDAAAPDLGYPSVKALQSAIKTFCG